MKLIQPVEFFVGVLIVVGSTCFLFLSLRFPRVIGGIPGPGLFPQLVLGSLIFLGLLTIFGSFSTKGTYKNSKIQKDWQSIRNVIIFTVYISLYGFFVMAGFFVYITPIFIFISTLSLLKFISKSINYVSLLLLSLSLTVVLYIVFIKILHIPLQ